MSEVIILVWEAWLTVAIANQRRRGMSAEDPQDRSGFRALCRHYSQQCGLRNLNYALGGGSCDHLACVQAEKGAFRYILTCFDAWK
jgi:hypothetical protein